MGTRDLHDKEAEIIGLTSHNQNRIALLLQLYDHTFHHPEVKRVFGPDVGSGVVQLSNSLYLCFP